MCAKLAMLVTWLVTITTTVRIPVGPINSGLSAIIYKHLVVLTSGQVLLLTDLIDIMLVLRPYHSGNRKRINRGAVEHFPLLF